MPTLRHRYGRASALAAGCVILVGSSSGNTTRGRQPDHAIVIEHVSIVDVEAGRVRRDRTVVIDGNRIVAIGPAGNPLPSRGAVQIDGRSRYLIPGLWDMHVHAGTYADGLRDGRLALSLGITGVRDMGSPATDIVKLRDDIRHGTVFGPRMVVAGPLLEAPLPFKNPMIVSVADAAAARSAVDSLADFGVDFIKVHDAPPREAYFEIALEAVRRGLPFAGHVPVGVSSIEAAAAGQASIEHLGGRFYSELLSVSRREAAIRIEINQIAADAMSAVRNNRDPDDSDLFRTAITRDLATSFDSGREHELIRTFRRLNTWQTPTLVAQPLREALESKSIRLTAEDRRHGAALLRLQGRLVRDMSRGGVGILAGTDGPIGRKPMASELGLLVAAGLTTTEALRTATLNPARFLHATDSLGTVSVGKLADLVLLDANPLADIRAVSRVRTVIANGRIVERSP